MRLQRRLMFTKLQFIDYKFLQDKKGHDYSIGRQPTLEKNTNKTPTNRRMTRDIIIWNTLLI